MDIAEVDHLEQKLKTRAYVYRLVAGFFPTFEDLRHLAEKHRWTEQQIGEAIESLENLRGEIIERAAIIDPVRTVA